MESSEYMHSHVLTSVQSHNDIVSQTPFFRVGEWTIEVMKAARTGIFEPEVGALLYVINLSFINFLLPLLYNDTLVFAGGLDG